MRREKDASTARAIAESTPGSAYWVSGWPKLVAEWHPTRNAGVQPHEVSHGSGRKLWWRCRRGPDHEWRASANNRTSGKTGCPFCAGRKVSATNSLANLRPDLARQWHPTNNGELTPHRVTAGSTRPVWWKCPAARDHEWRVSPHDRAHVEGGCPFCLGKRVSSTNSLAAKDRSLAAEWHPTKNGALSPDGVVHGSARVVWWRCRRHPSHEWRASLSNRSLRRSGCPFCSGRRATEQRSLAAAYPAIAREWHPGKNGDLAPDRVTPRASREVWWLCSHGHEWQSRVATRTRRGAGCPTCFRRARSGSQPANDGAAAGANRAALVIRNLASEHRRIEQILTLLAADPDVGEETWGRFASDLQAHLTAEETLIYPLLERTARGSLAEQRALDDRLRALLSKIAASRAAGALRAAQLEALTTAFRKHARFEEAVALPSLEGTMSAAALEALVARLSHLFRKRVRRTDGIPCP